jgi:hypothetical protein
VSTIDYTLPSQSVSSVTNAAELSFTNTVYAVMGDPLSLGATQSRITVFVDIVVTGATGAAGTSALRIVSESERREYPIAFCASIWNW